MKSWEDKETIEKKASSKSLNRTIKDLETLLERKRISTQSPKRQEMHDILFELLRSEARRWYQRGFHRGHETSQKIGKGVPKTISRRMRIRAPYIRKEGISIKLKSTIRRKKLL